MTARYQDLPYLKGIYIQEILASVAFRQGVADARAGRVPRFDGDEFRLMSQEKSERSNAFINRQWNYERGRLFGSIAPHNLRVITPRSKRVNPVAMRLYQAHFGGQIL